MGRRQAGRKEDREVWREEMGDGGTKRQRDKGTEKRDEGGTSRPEQWAKLGTRRVIMLS